MAISLVTSGIHDTNADGSSFTISSIQEGDLVIVTGASDSQDLDGPSGFTEGQLRNAGNTSLRSGWWYTFSTGTSITVSGLEGTTSSLTVAWIYQVFRGVSRSKPIHSTVTPQQASSGDPNPPSITTTIDGCMVLAFGMMDDDVVAASVSAPSGFTLIEANEAGTSGNGATNMSAYFLQTSAGTVDPSAFSTSGDDNITSYTIALRPKPNELITLDGVRTIIGLASDASLQDCFTAAAAAVPDNTGNLFPANNAAGADDSNSSAGWNASSNVSVNVVPNTDPDAGKSFDSFYSGSLDRLSNFIGYPLSDEYAIRLESRTSTLSRFADFEWTGATVNQAYQAIIRIQRTGNSNGTITNWQGDTAYSDDEDWATVGNDTWTTVNVYFTATSTTIQMRFYANGTSGTVSVGDAFEISRFIILEV